MDIDIIEPVDLTPERKFKLAQIMQAGNLVLKTSYLQAKAKQENSRYARCHFRKVLFDAMKKWNKKSPLTVEGVKISASDLLLISEVQKNEYLILQSVSKLICQNAKKWKRKLGTSFSELYQEGILAVVNSIYCFTNSEIKFSTYVTNSINRRFINIHRNNKSLSHWTNEDSKLFGQYERQIQIAEQRIDKTGKPHGATTFDELVQIMGLDDKERLALQSMLTGVIYQSDLRSNESGDNSINDFTTMRSDLKGNVHETLDIDQKDILNKLPMDELERAVLKAFLSASLGSHGWKSEVVRNLVNPKTNKPYSRAVPELVLRRLQKRVMKAYAELAA